MCTVRQKFYIWIISSDSLYYTAAGIVRAVYRRKLYKLLNGTLFSVAEFKWDNKFRGKTHWRTGRRQYNTYMYTHTQRVKETIQYPKRLLSSRKSSVLGNCRLVPITWIFSLFAYKFARTSCTHVTGPSRKWRKAVQVLKSHVRAVPILYSQLLSQ